MRAPWHDLTRSRPTLDLVERPCPVCRADGARAAPVATGIDFEYRTCANVFTFVRCRRCTTVFLNPRPRREDFGTIYPHDYYAFVLGREGEVGRPSNPLVQAAWDRLERRRLQLYVDLVGPRPAAVLDLGCGAGRLLRLLRRTGPPAWRLVGVEHGLSEAARASLADVGVTAHRGLYEELELPEAPFDLVVAQQVIEHATEPAELLAKIGRELAPGGFAVLDTPDYESLDRRLFQRSAWGGYHFPRHMTIFTAGTLARLAQEAGFEVVRTIKLVSPVFWVLSLQNLLRGAGAPAAIADLAHYQSLPLLGAATTIDLVSLATTGATSNLRLVLARRR